MQIVKRNGKIVDFDANKIKIAIKKANRESLFEAIDLAEFWLQDAIENG